jgi:hypothetical protein
VNDLDHGRDSSRNVHSAAAAVKAGCPLTLDGGGVQSPGVTELRCVHPEDYPRLAAYLTTPVIEPPELWLRRFAHWWDLNPALAPEIPRGWILVDDREVVGFLGNIPTWFRCADDRVRAFSATTWRVNPAHRSGSLKLYLAQVEIAEAALLFNNTANDKAARALAYLGFKSQPAYPTRKTHVVPIDGRLMLQTLMAGRPGVNLLAHALGPASRLMELPTRLFARARGEVVSLSSIGAEFDALWERSRRKYGFCGERTAERISWYVTRTGYFDKHVLGYFESSVLHGYLVLGETRVRGLPGLELLDVWTEDLERCGPSLLRGAFDHARRNGFAAVVLHAFDRELSQLYERLGLFATVDDTRQFHFRVGSDTKVDWHSERAYFTCFDGDLAV